MATFPTLNDRLHDAGEDLVYQAGVALFELGTDLRHSLVMVRSIEDRSIP